MIPKSLRRGQNLIKERETSANHSCTCCGAQLVTSFKVTHLYIRLVRALLDTKKQYVEARQRSLSEWQVQLEEDARLNKNLMYYIIIYCKLRTMLSDGIGWVVMATPVDTLTIHLVTMSLPFYNRTRFPYGIAALLTLLSVLMELSLVTFFRWH